MCLRKQDLHSTVAQKRDRIRGYQRPYQIISNNNNNNSAFHQFVSFFLVDLLVLANIIWYKNEVKKKHKCNKKI
jgi:hypothetical protein